MGLKNNSFVLSKLDALKTDPSADVRFQLALSLRFNDDPKAQSMINYMLRKYPNNDILVTSVKTYQESVGTEKERIAKEKLMNQASQLVMFVMVWMVKGFHLLMVNCLHQYWQTIRMYLAILQN
jgi:hypothetical protein